VSTEIKIDEFPADGRRWKVNWLGAIERGKTKANEPFIQVSLSPLNEEYLKGAKSKLSSKYAVDYDGTVYISIHSGQLQLVTIGSIWLDGVLQSEHTGDSYTFYSLNISPETVTFIKANHTVGGEPLISSSYYRYTGIGTDSWLAAIKVGDDPYKVLIPAMELLRFYYLTSERIAYHLFSGNFRHNRDAIYNSEKSGVIEPEGILHVQLRQGFKKIDGWSVARILTSEDAYRGAVMLHDQMTKYKVNDQPVHVESRFPFVGATTLKVRKKSIVSFANPDKEEEWHDLVLSIEECSAAFPFERLAVTLDNSCDTADPETDIDDKLKEERFPNQSSAESPDSALIQNQLSPSLDLATIDLEVKDSRFTAIKNKELEELKKDFCKYKSAKLSLPEVAIPDELSTEQGIYAGANVGQGNITTGVRYREESIGACFEAFERAVDKLNSREDYSARLRLSSASIDYIPLTKPSRSRQWSYLESSSYQYRAVISADIEYAGDWYTLIDFQLRESDNCCVGLIKKASGGYLQLGEFELLLKRLAPKKGVWLNIDLSGLDVELETLKHTWPNADRFADAIERKIGILTGFNPEDGEKTTA
jgi:hypothetical protein